MNDNNLRSNFKSIREKSGYSIRALSEKTGVSKTTIVNFEQGHFSIGVDKLETLLKAMEHNLKIE